MGKGFDFRGFLDETMGIITSPSSYFSTMKKEDGLFEPVLKTLLYGIIAVIIGFISIVLFKGGISTSTYYLPLISLLIAQPIVALLFVFIASLILLIISAICGGSANFQANMRVVASAMVVFPITTLLGNLYSINIYLHAVLSATVVLYGLWLLYLGLTRALGAKAIPASVIIAIIAVFPIFLCGRTIYYKAQGLKLPYEIEADRQREKIQKELKSMGINSTPYHTEK